MVYDATVKKAIIEICKYISFDSFNVASYVRISEKT